MSAKKTILIVEDHPSMIDMYEIFSGLSLADRYNVVIAKTFMEAAQTLFDPKNDIAGVIIDNGFPLSDAIKRQGKPEMEKLVENLSAEQAAAQKEQLGAQLREQSQQGSEGSMLIRFLRHGRTGARTAESKEALKGLSDVMARMGSHLPERLQQLRQVPLMWNSREVEEGKVAYLSDILYDRELTSTGAEYDAQYHQRYGDSSYLVNMLPGHLVAGSSDFSTEPDKSSPRYAPPFIVNPEGDIIQLMDEFHGARYVKQMEEGVPKRSPDGRIERQDAGGLKLNLGAGGTTMLCRKADVHFDLVTALSFIEKAADQYVAAHAQMAPMGYHADPLPSPEGATRTHPIIALPALTAGAALG